MADKKWKQTERKLAKLIGGERIPVSGRQRGFSADIQHANFSIEVKERMTLPVWLHDAMNQAEMSKRGDQIPLVILHQARQKFDQSFAVMRLSDLIALSKKSED